MKTKTINIDLLIIVAILFALALVPVLVFGCKI